MERFKYPRGKMMNMKKILLLFLCLLVVSSSVSAVRYYYAYGNVPEDTGGYVNDSYACFGSNVNRGNITGASFFTIPAKSSKGVLVAPFSGSGKQIATVDDNSLEWYSSTGTYLGGTSINGSLVGSGYVTNIDSDGQLEVTVIVNSAGILYVRTYEYLGSKIKDVSLGVDNGAYGIACVGSPSPICGVANGNTFYRVDMSAGTYLTTSITGMGYCDSAPVHSKSNAVWMGDLDGTDSLEGTMMYACMGFDTINTWVQVRAINVSTGNIQYSINDVVSNSYSSRCSSASENAIDIFQLGSRLSSLEWGYGYVCNGTSSVYNVYGSGGSLVFSRVDSNPIYGAKGSNYATADLNSDNIDDICFIRGNGNISKNRVYCYKNDFSTLLYNFTIPEYNADSKVRINIALGDVVKKENAIGKELITIYGIYNMSGSRIVSFGNVNASSSNAIIQVVDLNSDGADEVILSKKNFASINVYNANIVSYSPVVCVDSDGGNISTVLGASYYSNNHATNFTDICLNSTRLSESICSGGVPSFDNNDCSSYGYLYCVSGICTNTLSTSTTTTTIGTTTTIITNGSTTTIPVVCGNGVCQSSETHVYCPVDCLIVTCGDGICDVGETVINCPTDCSSEGLNFLLSPTDATRGLLPETATGLMAFFSGFVKLLPFILILALVGTIVFMFAFIVKLFR